jgi:UDP-N-acetylglucosamine transferase subunit ALG13
LERSLILLSLGTHQQPFRRALDLIEPVALAGNTVLVQHGSTKPRLEMPNVSWIELMPFEELVAQMAVASSVVCHAGVGTIMTSLQAGHTPVVIPRQAQYGEHVDNHQLDIAMRFAERGLVRCLISETDLVPLLTPRGGGEHGRMGNGSVALRAAVLEAAAATKRRHSLGFVRHGRHA